MARYILQIVYYEENITQKMNKRQQKEQKTAVKLKINSFRTRPLLISVLFDVLVELMKKKNIEANKKA